MNEPETWGVQGRTYIRGDLVVRKDKLTALVEDMKHDEAELREVGELKMVVAIKSCRENLEKLITSSEGESSDG